MSIERLVELEAEKSQILTEWRKKGKKELLPVFKPLFDKYPELESFSWTQYTPYFNDGDSCDFGVVGIDQINGWEEYDSEEWEEEVHRLEAKNGKYRHIEGPLYPAYQEAQKLVRSLPEDLLESILGDHIRVTVTRKSIETEEYSHD